MPPKRMSAGETAIMQQLQTMQGDITTMKEGMVTKKHFDTTIKKIKGDVAAHDKKLAEVDERLDTIESTSVKPETFYKELYEQECRKSCAILFRLPEQLNGTRKEKFAKEYAEVISLFKDMGIIGREDNVKMKLFRIGKTIDPAKPRPLKITFMNKETKEEVLMALMSAKATSDNIHRGVERRKLDGKLEKVRKFRFIYDGYRIEKS